MDDSSRAGRIQRYIGLNFLGTSDWAIDLQGFVSSSITTSAPTATSNSPGGSGLPRAAATAFGNSSGVSIKEVKQPLSLQEAHHETLVYQRRLPSPHATYQEPAACHQLLLQPLIACEEGIVYHHQFTLLQAICQEVEPYTMFNYSKQLSKTETIKPMPEIELILASPKTRNSRLHR